MNKSIKHELDVLFAEWESKMKENDNTSHFTRDGLMYNSIPNEQNEDFWFSSSKRVLFLLKDQNQQGMEKWDEDIREWLTDTANDDTKSLKRKEDNRNLSNPFIKKLAYLLWGLLKADKDNPWFEDEVTKYIDEVKDFFNTQPFAIVECKKQPGGGKLEDKILKQHLAIYGDLLKREIEILSPTMIVCFGGPIYDFAINKIYPQEELKTIHKNMRLHTPTGTLIFFSYHPSARGYIYDYGVMSHYRDFLEYQSKMQQ